MYTEIDKNFEEPCFRDSLSSNQFDVELTPDLAVTVLPSECC